MEILIIAYTAWAFFSGYRMVSGRIEWLDRKQPLNIFVKLVVSVIVGYIFGAFYLVYLILVFIGILGR